MHVKELKENIRGFIGFFIIRNDKLIGSDFESDQKNINSIIILSDAVSRRKTLQRLILHGEKRILVIYFHKDIILGVLMNKDANQYLIDYYTKKILEKPEELWISEKIPPELKDQIPYFDRSKEEVLANVSAYAGQVLKFVDGQRTIGQIVYQSNLPLDVVIGVIISFRRSSVLHYK